MGASIKCAFVLSSFVNYVDPLDILSGQLNYRNGLHGFLTGVFQFENDQIRSHITLSQRNDSHHRSCSQDANTMMVQT